MKEIPALRGDGLSNITDLAGTFNCVSFDLSPICLKGETMLTAAGFFIAQILTKSFP